jgi:hypothetical protein
VPVAGRDTDIPILLCHFYDPLKQNIIFWGGSHHNTTCKLWNIRKTIPIIGEDARKLLPASHFHSITGCDTTSRMFRIDKSAAFKKMKTSQHFKENRNNFKTNMNEWTHNFIWKWSSSLSVRWYPKKEIKPSRIHEIWLKIGTGSIAI